MQDNFYGQRQTMMGKMNKAKRDHILTEAYADLAKLLQKRISSGQILLRQKGKQKAISIDVPRHMLNDDIFHNAIVDLLSKQDDQPEFVIDDMSVRPVMQGYFTIELLRCYRRAKNDQYRLQPLPKYGNDEDTDEIVPDITDTQAYARLLNSDVQRDLARHIEAIIPPDWLAPFLQHVVFAVPTRTVALRLRLPVSKLESRFRHFKQELRKALSAYAPKRSQRERSHEPQHARIG
jgi:DNA-directed RNA polymerase specialized sigma24 family protein